MQKECPQFITDTVKTASWLGKNTMVLNHDVI